MPVLGETQPGRKIGHNSGTLYVWHACIDCGTERWAPKKQVGEGTHLRCRICGPKMTVHSGVRKTNFQWDDNIKGVKRAIELGLKGECVYVLVACPTCHKERWTRWSGYHKNPGIKCNSCAARAAIMATGPYRGGTPFKGIRTLKWQQGYLRIWLDPQDPLHVMADKGHYLMQHRLVMARHVGRPLLRYETVHHINGDRADNRIENLELWHGKHLHGVRLSQVPHCPTCTCGKASAKP